MPTHCDFARVRTLLPSAGVLPLVAAIALATLPCDVLLADTAHLVLHYNRNSSGTSHDFDLQYQTPGTDGIGQLIGDFVNGLPSNVFFSVDHNDSIPTTHAQLQFDTTKMGVPLAIDSYLDATRSPFSAVGKPGMNVIQSFQGSTQIHGNFTVHDIGAFRNSLGKVVISRFSVSFEQFGEVWPAGIVGTFDYVNAVPEPGSLILAASGLISLALYGWRKRSRGE